MNTININKLEDLKDHKWDFKNAHFQLKENSSYFHLYHTNAIDIFGRSPVKVHLKNIDFGNLSELEFYGLKVIVSKKIALTQKEKACLERFNASDYFIARSGGSTLRIFSGKPEQNYKEWVFIDEFNNTNYGIPLKYNLLSNNRLFPFITWESGKAWSKAELMELDVID